MEKKDIHKYTHPNDVRKDYLENRTSWKWFERILKKETNYAGNNAFPAHQIAILLEILKELQYLNDKK